MKKLILSILIGISITGCSGDTDKERIEKRTGSGTFKSAQDVTFSDMHYIIIDHGSDGVFVINVTKDSLEVEKLLKK